MHYVGSIRCVAVAMALEDEQSTARAASRLSTPAMMSITGLASRPGTAVLPMCSISPAHEKEADRTEKNSCSASKRIAQSGLDGTRCTGASSDMLRLICGGHRDGDGRCFQALDVTNRFWRAVKLLDHAVGGRNSARVGPSGGLGERRKSGRWHPVDVAPVPEQCRGRIPPPCIIGAFQ